MGSSVRLSDKVCIDVDSVDVEGELVDKLIGRFVVGSILLMLSEGLVVVSELNEGETDSTIELVSVFLVVGVVCVSKTVTVSRLSGFIVVDGANTSRVGIESVEAGCSVDLTVSGFSLTRISVSLGD